VLPSAHLSPQPKWQINWFSHFCTAHSRVSLVMPGMSIPLIIAPSHGGSGLPEIHASLGQPESTTQMASQSVQPFSHSSCKSVIRHVGACCTRAQNPNGISVQPFLHRWPQSVPILYNFRPSLLKIVSTHGGMWTLSNTWFLGPTSVLNPNRISIGWAVFWRSHYCDRPTDGPHYVVLRCGL